MGVGRTRSGPGGGWRYMYVDILGPSVSGGLVERILFVFSFWGNGLVFQWR